MSTADKLSKLLETKEAIKQAIIDKGGTVGDVFADYPAAIQNIEGGGGSGTFVVPGGMRFAYSRIKNFPEDWDWSEFEKETNLSNAFNANEQLIALPNISPAPTSLDSCFMNCKKLKRIDFSNWDTSNCTSMDRLFQYCNNLRSVGYFDTSKIKNFNSMFAECTMLRDVPQLNATSNTNSYSQYNSPLANCNALRNFGGFKGINKTLYVDKAYSLSYESLLNIINGLAEGVSGQTLYLHQDLVNQLSDDDIAIATNKGWSISPSKTMTETVVVTDLSQVPSGAYNINPKTYDFSQYTGSWASGTSAALKCSPSYFEADLSGTTDASYMFKGKISLKGLNLTNTSNITNMNYMFYGCSSLDIAPILNTSKVTDMDWLFYGCTYLESATMIGGLENLKSYRNCFSNVGVHSKPDGTFYYDSRYDYSKIIAELPENWTAVPITV